MFMANFVVNRGTWPESAGKKYSEHQLGLRDYQWNTVLLTPRGTTAGEAPTKGI
jgi:hypothetical protein